MIDDVLELFRGQYVVVYFLIILPVTLSLSPTQKTSGGAPNVVQEFKVFRLQHFDLQGTQHGKNENFSRSVYFRIEIFFPC